jgi:hypothetical protein
MWTLPAGGHGVGVTPSLPPGRWRTVLAAVLLLAATVLGTVGGVALCFRDTVVDADEFGRRTVEAMARPDSREVIARRVTAEVVERAPETAVVRPLIEIAVQGALASDAFQQILAAATADLHRTVLAGNDDTLTLRLVDWSRSWS